MWLADLFSTRKTNQFYDLSQQQAALLFEAAGAFKQFVTTGAQDGADRIDGLRREGHALVDQITTALRDAFVTPIDRQDIYNLTEDLDDMLGYIDNAAREIKLFETRPTEQMQAMADVLLTAAGQIKEAVEHLKSDPARSWRCAKAAQATEGLVEDLYRHAVVALFDENDIHVILKQREIYRHLSNSADRAEALGRLIGKIVVKAT